jgi:arylsulfatase A-like enzyme
MGWTDWEQNGGKYGSSYYETPNMNRLAEEGVTFSNAYSSAAVCSPTRNALLTGKHPARTRMTQWLPGYVYDSMLSDPRWDRTLRDEEVTLAEALRAGGYATGFVGKWHLGNRFSASANPLDHGFDSNVGGDHHGGPNPYVGYFANGNGSFGLPGLGPGSSVPGDYLTDRLTDFAVDFIDRYGGRDEPFFLLMSHYGVHIPLEARADLVAKYRAKPPSGGHADAAYAAMLESVDVSLGRVLDELEDEGIRDDTIIVFTSDNGGSLLATSNAPLRDGKGLLYEGGIRTPLIVSWTGNDRITQGADSEAIVVTHDLYPTLLDLTQVPGDRLHNDDVDGSSFRRALEGKNRDRAASFWHYPHISPQSTQIRGGRYVSAARVGDWKLIYFYEEESWELYDLGSDIGETVNLIEECSGVASRVGELLVEWLLEVEAQLPIDDSTGQAVALPSPVPELKRRSNRRRWMRVGEWTPPPTPGEVPLAGGSRRCGWWQRRSPGMWRFAESFKHASRGRRRLLPRWAAWRLRPRASSRGRPRRAPPCAAGRRAGAVLPRRSGRGAGR